MCNQENNDINGLIELLEKILIIQRVNRNKNNGCDKPFLGEITSVLANTRPITLYTCCANNTWTIPYSYNEQTGTSNIFRIENINDNIATFRILISQNDSYIATDNYFTIDLRYVSCIKCLQDALISNI